MNINRLYLVIGILGTVIILTIGVTDFIDDGGSTIFRSLLSVFVLWFAVWLKFKQSKKFRKNE
ncbi:hypothetical protein VBD025_06225 [Virgibacillus flavescens]|uniref:hypothetical protein n=1 Tax=Virgibacillus flavescens TaxID=1611422 RepID=UPI003D32DC57